MQKYWSKVRHLLGIAHQVGAWNFIRRYSVRLYYKLSHRPQTITLSNGGEMILPCTSRFGTELFLTRDQLDWGSEYLLMRFLEGDKDFIDIGANIGYYSLLAAPVCKSVYAFEPDPRVAQFLDKNLAGFNHCKVFQEALYSEVTTMTLNLSSLPELNSLTRRGTAVDSLTVKVTTLDCLMDEYPSLKVSCIKIDAEGADYDILAGGRRLLTRDQPLVLAEIWPTQRLFTLAQEIGFDLFAFVKPKLGQKGAHQPAKLIRIEPKPTNLRLKMLFLVPKRLLSDFEASVDSQATAQFSRPARRSPQIQSRRPQPD